MINKNIIALGFVSFFTDMASSMVTTILPLYVVYILNDGVDKLGIIIAVATFVSYFFRIIFGIISDRYKIVKPFVVIGYLISAVTKPLLAFASSWKSVALLRGLERIGKAVRAAPKDRLISFYAGDKSGRSFGFHKMLDIAGEMSGAVIVFFVLKYMGENAEVFKNIFLSTIIPGIFAVLIVVFFVKDVPYQKKEKQKFDLSRDKKLLPLLFVYFGFLFFMFSNEYFIIKAKEAGFSMALIPLLVILLNFTQTVTSYYFGVLIDKLGYYKVLNYSFLNGFLAILSIYFNFIILGFIFLGLFLVSSLNSLRSYISDNAVNKASVYGIFYGGVAISSSIGAVIIGEIWHNFGEKYALIYSITGIILVYIIYLLKVKNDK
jgi:MFS family permease